MPPNIFVSYSHADSSLVAPIVALLRASNAFVYLDADSIQPGKRWRDEIVTAIYEASIVVVFWCHHARASDEVEKEFKTAIAHGKDVLPLLLDETPLPSDLADFQYIDFRGTFGNGHVIKPTHINDVIEDRGFSTKSSRSIWYIGLIVTVFLVLLTPLFALGPSDLPVFTLVLGFFLFLAVLLRWITRKLLSWRTRKNRIRKREGTVSASSFDVYDQQTLLASTIEAELRRRTRANKT